MKNWIEVNGVSLCYELAGEDKPLVVLVHELGGSLDSWEEALPHFQRRFRTLRYDQRGCGLSEKLRGPITIADMIADLTGLLDGLGIRQPCHVTGFALGSATVLALAARHPARVASIAVSSPVPGSTSARREIQIQRAAMVKAEGMRASAQQSLSVSYPEALRGNRQRFERYRSIWLASDPHCYAAMTHMLGDIDLTPELANIRCPALIMGSRYDVQRTPEFARSVAARIPGATYADIETGHFAAVQTPELFAQLAVNFFSANAGA